MVHYLGHSRKGIRADKVHNLIEWGRYSNIILGFRLGNECWELVGCHSYCS